MSECSHTWHLEHDTERRLNKDANCDLVMQRLAEKKKNSSLWRRKKKRISEAFFETLSLQISTALSFRVLPAHAPYQGNGKRMGIQHRAFCSRASLCIPACCCYGYRWSLRSYRPVFLVPVWFRCRFWCVLPIGSQESTNPWPCFGTVYLNS